MIIMAPLLYIYIDLTGVLTELCVVPSHAQREALPSSCFVPLLSTLLVPLSSTVIHPLPPVKQ